MVLRKRDALAPPLTMLDVAGISIATALFLLLSFLRSRHTIFWSDEIMGWLVLREQTFPGLLHSWWAGADSSGIFFYLFARPWLGLFGATELSLRLFTAAGVACASALLWLCARRFYSFGVVAALVPLTLLFHGTLLWQLSNGRTYGILLAAVALTAYAFALTDPDLPLTAGLLWLTFAAHLLLVGSHILGPLYSGIFLGGLLLRDLLLRTFRLRLYLAGLAGWIVLAVSYRNLLATAALGKPAFWTEKPHHHQFFLGFSVGSPSLRRAIAVLFLGALLTYLIRYFRDGRLRGIRRTSITRLTLIATFFLCVPVLFLLSRVTTSIFVDRYLLPVLLGDALLLCELATRILDELSLPLRVRQALFASLLVVLALVVRRDLPLSPKNYPQADYTSELLALLPPGLPVVITHPGVFAEMDFYRSADRTFLTPLDWQVTLDPAMNPGYVSGTHEMENWKKLGYSASQIQSTAMILTNNPKFVVVAEDGQDVWFKRRIVDSGQYTTEDLGRHQETVNRLHLWLVEHR